MSRTAPRSKPAWIWLAAVGFVTSFAYLASPWFTPQSGFSEEERIAIHLAAGDGFASPFSSRANAPPTSWCPPVYCAFIAAVYRLAGVESNASVALILVFNHACRVAAGIGLYVLGSRGYGRRAGWVAAIAFFVHPIFLQMPSYCWDNSLALAMFFWLIVLATGRTQKLSNRSLITLGAGMSILVLTNTAYILSLPVLTWLGARGRARSAMIISLWMTATLAPWTLRNAAAFHQLMLVRSNADVELWLGNQPGSSGWLTLANLNAHPSGDASNRRLVLTLGEPGFDALCRNRFIAEMKGDAGGFIARTLNRAAFLMTGNPQARAWCLLSSAGCVLGIAGAWTSWRRKKIAGLRWLILGMSAVAPYLITQVYDRYAMPLRALMILLSAVAIDDAWRRCVRHHSTD